MDSPIKIKQSTDGEHFYSTAKSYVYWEPGKQVSGKNLEASRPSNSAKYFA